MAHSYYGKYVNLEGRRHFIEVDVQRRDRRVYSRIVGQYVQSSSYQLFDLLLNSAVTFWLVHFKGVSLNAQREEA